MRRLQGTCAFCTSYSTDRHAILSLGRHYRINPIIVLIAMHQRPRGAPREQRPSREAHHNTTLRTLRTDISCLCLIIAHQESCFANAHAP
jgi:hypothetical protein